MTSNISGNGTSFNCPNYLGEFLTIGQNETPFLNAIGGIENPFLIVQSTEFPLNQYDEMEAASQPDISENASFTAPTATTYVRAQQSNVIQLFQRAISLSYVKAANAQNISGISITGLNQPVKDEKQNQIEKNLKQIAIDANYSFLNGTYEKAGDADGTNKTRGISTAISTNTVAGSAATLTMTMIENLAKEMVDNGARVDGSYIFCNSHQTKVINSIYGYAPESKTEGGTTVRKILTSFGTLNLIYEPKVTTSELLVIDLGIVKVAGQVVPDKGVLFYEDLAKAGGAEKGQLYGLLGIAYGHESKHGKITGLATS